MRSELMALSLVTVAPGKENISGAVSHSSEAYTVFHRLVPAFLWARQPTSNRSRCMVVFSGAGLQRFLQVDDDCRPVVEMRCTSISSNSNPEAEELRCSAELEQPGVLTYLGHVC